MAQTDPNSAPSRCLCQQKSWLSEATTAGKMQLQWIPPKGIPAPRTENSFLAPPQRGVKEGWCGEQQARLTPRCPAFPEHGAGVEQGKGVGQQLLIPRGRGARDGQAVLQGWAPLCSLQQQDLHREHTQHHQLGHSKLLTSPELLVQSRFSLELVLGGPFQLRIFHHL